MTITDFLHYLAIGNPVSQKIAETSSSLWTKDSLEKPSEILNPKDPVGSEIATSSGILDKTKNVMHYLAIGNPISQKVVETSSSLWTKESLDKTSAMIEETTESETSLGILDKTKNVMHYLAIGNPISQKVVETSSSLWVKESLDKTSEIVDPKEAVGQGINETATSVGVLDKTKSVVHYLAVGNPISQKIAETSSSLWTKESLDKTSAMVEKTTESESSLGILDKTKNVMHYLAIGNPISQKVVETSSSLWAKESLDKTSEIVDPKEAVGQGINETATSVGVLDKTKSVMHYLAVGNPISQKIAKTSSSLWSKETLEKTSNMSEPILDKAKDAVQNLTVGKTVSKQVDETVSSLVTKDTLVKSKDAVQSLAGGNTLSQNMGGAVSSLAAKETLDKSNDAVHNIVVGNTVSEKVGESVSSMSSLWSKETVEKAPNMSEPILDKAKDAVHNLAVGKTVSKQVDETVSSLVTKETMDNSKDAVQSLAVGNTVSQNMGGAVSSLATKETLDKSTDAVQNLVVGNSVNQKVSDTVSSMTKEILDKSKNTTVHNLAVGNTVGKQIGETTSSLATKETLIGTTTDLTNTIGAPKTPITEILPQKQLLIQPAWNLTEVHYTFFRLAAVSGVTAVVLGIYASYLLKEDENWEIVENETNETTTVNNELNKRNTKKYERKDMSVFYVANSFHLMHSIALLGMPFSKYPIVTGSLMIAGTSLFSGALYYQAFTGKSSYSNMVPAGGICLITAWLSFLL